MLSIIICSRKTDIPDELKHNIAETIGCEYELVILDNSSNKSSIFQAYNEGIRRAKGAFLCFMHEDVLYRSKNWGDAIERHFQKEERIGLIGFAGSHFLPDTPMYWYGSPFVSQHNLNNDQGVIEEHFHEEWFGEKDLIETIVVDGLCFFAKRELFHEISFDEKVYKGFHLYDMDICMQVHEAGYKVCVCRDVLVEHTWSEREQFSKPGGELFDRNLELFAQKWHSRLPIHKGLDLPEEVFERVNVLFRRAYEAKKVRKSKAYRLGKILLMPLKWIKHDT